MTKLYIGRLKREAKKIYKSDVRRNAGIGVVAFVIKAALFLIIATIQFLCAQKFSNAFIYGIPSLLFWLAYALSFIFVVLPINTGLGTYFAKISAGKKCRTDNIFAHFQQFKTDVAAQILVFLTVFAEFIVWQIVSLVLYKILSMAGIASYSYIAIFTAALFFLIFAAVALYTLIVFSPVSYIIEHRENSDAIEIYKSAAEFTRGNRKTLLKIFFSFGGYIVLSFLTLGIGFIWLNPYINITTKLFFDKIERGL